MQLIRMADYHMELLTKHRRICAKPLARFKMEYKCADRSDALERIFGVAIRDDNADMQPPSFCHSCYNVLVHSHCSGIYLESTHRELYL